MVTAEQMYSGGIWLKILTSSHVLAYDLPQHLQANAKCGTFKQYTTVPCEIISRPLYVYNICNTYINMLHCEIYLETAGLATSC